MPQIKIQEKRITINPVRDKLTSFSVCDIQSIPFQIFDKKVRTTDEKQMIGQIIALSEDPNWIT